MMTVDCTLCHGTGTKDCFLCHGTGKGTMDCVHCHGTGHDLVLGVDRRR